MSAREKVLERVTRVADDTLEREEFVGDVMQKIIREGSGYFMQYKMKHRLPPPDFFEKMAGQLMAIAFAYEEQREKKIGFVK